MEDYRMELEIKKSQIQGKGLFTNKDIAEGTKISYFEGEEMTRADFYAKYKRDMRYVYQRPNFISKVLHCKEKRNLISYVNSPSGTDMEANVVLKRRWMIALRDIPAGSELLLDYPRGYFESY